MSSYQEARSRADCYLHFTQEQAEAWTGELLLGSRAYEQALEPLDTTDTFSVHPSC